MPDAVTKASDQQKVLPVLVSFTIENRNQVFSFLAFEPG
jgi:hypothetical protein